MLLLKHRFIAMVALPPREKTEAQGGVQPEVSEDRRSSSGGYTSLYGMEAGSSLRNPFVNPPAIHIAVVADTLSWSG